MPGSSTSLGGDVVIGAAASELRGEGKAVQVPVELLDITDAVSM
jgi:hypothetical protein